MKFHRFLYFFGLLATCASQATAQAVVNVTWGNEIFIPPNDGAVPSIFADSAGIGFTSGTAVVAVGGFTSLPTFEPTADTFDNFVVVAESTTFNPSLQGFFDLTENDLDASGWASVVGETAYIAVAKGATTFSNLDSASEYGVWSSSTWDPLPSGAASPTPTPSYAAQLTATGTSFTTLLGTVDPDGGINDGNSFQTEAIPEPSAYATILGLLGLSYAVFCRRRRSSSTN